MHSVDVCETKPVKLELDQNLRVSCARRLPPARYGPTSEAYLVWSTSWRDCGSGGTPNSMSADGSATQL
jgi:hypothetical protein